MNVVTVESATGKTRPTDDAKRPRKAVDKENEEPHDRVGLNARTGEEDVSDRRWGIKIIPESWTIDRLRTLPRPGRIASPGGPLVVERCGKVVENGTVDDWRFEDDCFRFRFRLEDKRPYADRLAPLYPFSRDDRIVFNEAAHKYFVDGNQVPWSVTRFAHCLSHGFDPTSAVRTMMESATWHERHPELTSADGEPMTGPQIIEAWRVNGETQRLRGTLMHWHVELYLNGYDLAEPQSPEFLQFLAFKRRFMDPLGLVPMRTEVSMFHCGLCIAGQADLVCFDVNGDAVIIDWKRSGKINTRGFRGQKLFPPLDYIDDCNWSTYCLQINTYAYILESEYGLRVAALYIAVFHPKHSGVPHVYVVPRMTAEVQLLVGHAASVYGTRLQSLPGDTTPFDATGFRSDVLGLEARN